MQTKTLYRHSPTGITPGCNQDKIVAVIDGDSRQYQGTFKTRSNGKRITVCGCWSEVGQLKIGFRVVKEDKFNRKIGRDSAFAMINRRNPIILDCTKEQLKETFEKAFLDLTVKYVLNGRGLQNYTEYLNRRRIELDNADYQLIELSTKVQRLFNGKAKSIEAKVISVKPKQQIEANLAAV